jgi:SAM-dependent methyltransferase
MTHRSRSLISRLRPHLPASGSIADVGSGTGHNAEEIRRLKNIFVHEFDVADLHWIGRGPEIIEGNRIPAEDDTFDGLMMLFVLHYPDSPKDLLKECCRVTHGPVIVVQSTYRGWWGRSVLAIREFFWGRLALRLALFVGLVRPVECPLKPRRHFKASELIRLFEEAGLVVVTSIPAEWWGLCVSRDLFVLKPGKS